jgi:thiamine-monophosphate kinase
VAAATIVVKRDLRTTLPDDGGLPLSTRPGGSTGEGAVRVADLGEFGLIDRLARIVALDAGDPLRPPSAGPIGIGDDAALWVPEEGKAELLTTDALVEGVHFRLHTTGWRDLGWKALAANVSDIAAMGGQPRRAFVTLGMPGHTRLADLDELYRGFVELARRHDLAIAGGDTVSSPVMLISVAIVGVLEGSGLRRSAGRVGDLLAVTGRLGASAGGLALLEGETPDRAGADADALMAAHRRPSPRVAEAIVLTAAGVVCGMDVSDGLLGDGGKLAYASDCAAVLDWEAIPVHPSVERLFGERARGLALRGGEDYELLVAGPAERIERAAAELERAGLEPLSVVGHLAEGPAGCVRVVDESGADVAAVGGSWNHFGGGCDG